MLAVRTHAQVPPSVANPAVIATERLQFSWWADRHKAIVEAAHSRPDTQLLLIGDSIINNYDKQLPPDENFSPTWNEFYEPRKAMNLGFSGDTTANVLWRIDQGEVDRFSSRFYSSLSTSTVHLPCTYSRWCSARR